MEDKDGDTWYCFYAVMKLHWKPYEFAFLSPKERALMYVFIDTRLKEEEKQQKKLRNKGRSGGRSSSGTFW